MSGLSDYVCIYSGPGTNPLCVNATKESFIKILGSDGQRRVICIDHSDDFSSKCLKYGNTLVVPGGNSREIGQFFSGSEKVDDFIRNYKGSFIGICAGAYLSGPSDQFREPLFNFTSLKLLGLSTTESCDFKDGRYVKVVEVMDSKSNSIMKLIWWLGGSYAVSNESEETVAHYHPKFFDRAAVIRPRDNVLLTNVHPEFQISGNFYKLDLSSEQKSLLSKGEEVTDWFKSQLTSIGIKLEGQETISEVKPTFFEKDTAVSFSSFENDWSGFNNIFTSRVEKWDEEDARSTFNAYCKKKQIEKDPHSDEFSPASFPAEKKEAEIDLYSDEFFKTKDNVTSIGFPAIQFVSSKGKSTTNLNQRVWSNLF